MNNKKYMILVVVLVIVLACLIGYFIKDNSSNNTNNSNYSEKNNSTNSNSVTNDTYSTSDMFTDRDLEQTVDTTDATKYTVASGKDISITKEGVYVISGTATNSTIYVEADDEAKIQIVLDGVHITNTNFPCIYVKSGDKVFITTSTDSSLTVSGTFKADGDTNTDGVIFSKSDVTLNGTATLTINSTDNSVGYIYISGGNITINAGDDGIHATTIAQFEGGTINITAGEGIEGTFILINNGTINIKATDDGINAANKSSKYSIKVEINGGTITVDMGQGDTDAIDSNGDLLITGGTITINAQSPFDYDGTGSKTGGKLIVNGSETDTLSNQMMGGGMRENNGRRR